MTKVNQVKWVIYILAMLPIISVIKEVPTKIDPYDYGLEATGIWMTIWFATTLLTGPVARLLKKPKGLSSKQPLGLATFTWAILHLSYYIYYNQSKLSEAIIDIMLKPTIMVGAISFIILLALTVTSTKKAVSILRKRWNVLHRTGVVAAAMGGAHALSFQKVTTAEGGIMGLTLITVVMIRYAIEMKRAK